MFHSLAVEVVPLYYSLRAVGEECQPESFEVPFFESVEGALKPVEEVLHRRVCVIVDKNSEQKLFEELPHKVVVCKYVPHVGYLGNQKHNFDFGITVQVSVALADLLHLAIRLLRILIADAHVIAQRA